MALKLSSEALEAARMNPLESLREGQGTAIKGIVLNGLLGLAKLAAGILGHSYAVIADAAESFNDVVGSSIAFFGLRVAATPADHTHPLGHGRAETIASGITALVLVFVGALVFWRAGVSLTVPRVAPDPRTLLVLLPVIAAKEAMFRWMRLRATAIGSRALVSEAWHQRSDVITSVCALFGISAAWIGGAAWNHADSWAAMLSSVWLMGTGLWLLGPTLHELMEGSPDPALQQFIGDTSNTCEGVRGIDRVWVRKLGMRLLVDLHVEVAPDISVLDGHRIAHQVKARLQQELPQISDVMVHIEPYDATRARRDGHYLRPDET